MFFQKMNISPEFAEAQRFVSGCVSNVSSFESVT